MAGGKQDGKEEGDQGGKEAHANLKESREVVIMNKVRWADMSDDDPFPTYELEEPTVISKHGIRIKKDVTPPTAKYVPPHRQDKTSPPVKDK